MNAPEKIAQLARMIALDELHPSPTNPRSRMKASDLKELADSSPSWCAHYLSMSRRLRLWPGTDVSRPPGWPDLR